MTLEERKVLESQLMFTDLHRRYYLEERPRLDVVGVKVSAPHSFMKRVRSGFRPLQEPPYVCVYPSRSHCELRGELVDKDYGPSARVRVETREKAMRLAIAMVVDEMGRLLEVDAYRRLEG